MTKKKTAVLETLNKQQYHQHVQTVLNQIVVVMTALLESSPLRIFLTLVAIFNSYKDTYTNVLP